MGLAVYTIGTVTAPACSAISLGDDASLNGFVPFPRQMPDTNIVSAPVDPNSEAIVAASGFAGAPRQPRRFGSTLANRAWDSRRWWCIVQRSPPPADQMREPDDANESDAAAAICRHAHRSELWTAGMAGYDNDADGAGGHCAEAR